MAAMPPQMPAAVRFCAGGANVRGAVRSNVHDKGGFGGGLELKEEEEEEAAPIAQPGAVAFNKSV
eukprot:1282225-Rhodomonas_salina.1